MSSVISSVCCCSAEVIFAVFVCALAVHAAAVRLMFAMARDNNLPFAACSSHVSPRTRAPVVPALVIGFAGRGDPDCERQPSQRDRVALFGRHHLGQPGISAGDHSTLDFARKSRGPRRVRRRDTMFHGLEPCRRPRPYFSLGRLGPSGQRRLAVLWGLFVVINMSWPRLEIYGSASLGPVRGAAGNPRAGCRRVLRIMFSINESAPESCQCTCTEKTLTRIAPGIEESNG